MNSTYGYFEHLFRCAVTGAICLNLQIEEEKEDTSEIEFEFVDENKDTYWPLPL